MMAPHYLQAILIKMATDEAVDRFLTIPPEPIEKVEVIGRTVVVTAGNRCVTMMAPATRRVPGPGTSRTPMFGR